MTRGRTVPPNSPCSRLPITHTKKIVLTALPRGSPPKRQSHSLVLTSGLLDNNLEQNSPDRSYTELFTHSLFPFPYSCMLQSTTLKSGVGGRIKKQAAACDVSVGRPSCISRTEMVNLKCLAPSRGQVPSLPLTSCVTFTRA